MQVSFTKMQGAGNDFVVLDETRQQLGLSTAQYRWLADRHFGVGADQILTVRPGPAPGVDFEYIIHNADGAQVEQCGNGARCFARFVRDQGLTTQDRIRVQTMSGIIEPLLTADGRVTVDMGAPVFDLARIPFDPQGAQPVSVGAWEQWALNPPSSPAGVEGVAPVLVAAVSMGNPHAVQLVDDVDHAPVAVQGPWIEHHPTFPKRVNAGFMQIIDRRHVKLRVYERGAGETLACGTGACAAVVAGIRLGLLDAQVDVQTRGGVLTIAWDGLAHNNLRLSVHMTGPATTVFHGTVDVPDNLSNP